jgi:HEAT repeat protein
LECKRFACRQLAVIGTAQNVEDISEYLVNPDLSDMARYAIQPIADASVDRALIESLSEAPADSDTMIAGLISSLGARGSQKAIPALRKRAMSENATIAEAAIAALGRVGGPKAARALASLKGSATPELAAAVSHAQLAVADGLLAAGQRDRAAAIYESLVDSAEPDSIRAAAFVGVAKSGGLEGSGEAWRKRIDEDPVLREASAGYLHKVAAQYQHTAEEQASK